MKTKESTTDKKIKSRSDVLNMSTSSKLTNPSDSSKIGLTRFITPLFNVVKKPKYLLFGALSIFAVVTFFFPQVIAGKLSFHPFPQARTIQLMEQLTDSGFSISQNDFTPVLIKDNFTLLPLHSSLIGNTVLFLGKTKNQAKNELYSVRITTDGNREILLSKPINVSHTADANEFSITAVGQDLYCLSHASGVTILTHRRHSLKPAGQFIHVAKTPLFFAPSSTSTPTDTVMLTSDNKTLFPVNCLTGTSGKLALRYIPAVSGSEPFLPWLVQQVRSISFIGPEGIAWLEDKWYGTTDYFKRKWHGNTEEEFSMLVSDEMEEEEDDFVFEDEEEEETEAKLNTESIKVIDSLDEQNLPKKDLGNLELEKEVRIADSSHSTH